MKLPLLARSSLRHFAEHPWQGGLAVLGVALGVAVVVAIRLANLSALTAFQTSAEAVTGGATHHVVAGSRGVPDELYRRLAIEVAGGRAAPVVEGRIEIPGPPAVPLRLLGVDPLAEAARGRRLADAAAGGGLTALLTEPGAVLLPAATIEAAGLAPGERFAISAAARRRTAKLVGSLRGAGVGVDDLAVADIATAQELLDRGGRLSRIDLWLDGGPAGEDTAERIQAALPAGVEIVAAESRALAGEELTHAFRVNLQALSLLALLCGGFLIYNTVGFAVVQRRPLFGRLRALGVTGRELAAVIVGEALAIGGLGAVLGLALGVALAHRLIDRVALTINDLYFTVAVRSVEAPPSALAAGLALGVGGSALAALAPALEAATAPPRGALERAELERRVRGSVPAVTALGLALGLVGAVLLALPASLAAAAPGGELVPAFGGLFAVLLGFALLTPLATLTISSLLAPPAGGLFGSLGRMTVRGLAASLSRTAVAIAALMMTVSVTVGVDLMVGSFRGTVARWLDLSLPADLYVSLGAGGADRFTGPAPGLEPAEIDRLRRLPAVDRVSTVRQAEAESPDGPLRLVAHDLDDRGRAAFSFTAGRPRTAWKAFSHGAVLIAEPLAFRRRLEPGDAIELSTPAGLRRLEIAGVIRDFATERGGVLLDRRLYRELYSDELSTAAAIFAAPGTDLAALERAVREVLSARPQALVRSNRVLRAQSLEVFDRTFLITGVLRTLAVLVAFVGVLSALTALQLERRRELGVLRALGLTPRQVWCVVTGQTGLMGLVAGLLSIPAGLLTAAIMVQVIQRRSFGWTLELAVEPGPLLAAVTLAVGAGLLAGILPAARMAHTSPAEALRAE